MNGVVDGFVVIGIVIVVGYLLGRSGLLGPGSVQAGLGMVLLGLALFLRAHPNVLQLLTGRGPDSRLARGALGGCSSG